MRHISPQSAFAKTDSMARGISCALLLRKQRIGRLALVISAQKRRKLPLENGPLASLAQAHSIREKDQRNLALSS
jgi:hypothetical protein